MISGSGYRGWVEYGEDGWYVRERGPWTVNLGPYRWKWEARLALWLIAP